MVSPPGVTDKWSWVTQGRWAWGPAQARQHGYVCECSSDTQGVKTPYVGSDCGLSPDSSEEVAVGVGVTMGLLALGGGGVWLCNRWLKCRRQRPATVDRSQRLAASQVRMQAAAADRSQSLLAGSIQ
jgi:hypothetical protein